MSHVTKVETEIRDREVLLEILEEAGWFSFEGPGRQIQIPWNQRDRICLQADSDGGPYEILFPPSVSRRERKRFTDTLHQRYARRKILREAARRHYVLVREETCADRRIRLVLRRVA